MRDRELPELLIKTPDNKNSAGSDVRESQQEPVAGVSNTRNVVQTEVTVHVGVLSRASKIHQSGARRAGE